jgi:hypothetical protein
MRWIATPRRLAFFILTFSLSTPALGQDTYDIRGDVSGAWFEITKQLRKTEPQDSSPTDASCFDKYCLTSEASVKLPIARVSETADSQSIRDVNKSTPNSIEPTTYMVDGLSLGGKVIFDSNLFKQYKCNLTEYPGMTYCNKQQLDHTGRGEAMSWTSIIHNQDGTIVYANRYITPAFFDHDDMKTEIDRLSAKFDETARVLQMPKHEGLPGALIAVWGQLKLEQITTPEVATVASGESLHKGILV